MGTLRWELGHYREQENTDAAEAFRERYLRRMWDLSEFMKTLKQRFTRWFNRRHRRKGTLWEDRFKSVLVEDGHAARTMAAYIDLNPVRAGMVDDPKDYRWCSFAEAVAGRNRSREGLQRVLFEEDCTLTSEERASEMLLNWGEHSVSNDSLMVQRGAEIRCSQNQRHRHSPAHPPRPAKRWGHAPIVTKLPGMCSPGSSQAKNHPRGSTTRRPGIPWSRPGGRRHFER